MFRSSISSEVNTEREPEPVRDDFSANVFLLSEGQHLENDGVLVWWQGPNQQPRRFAIQDGGARVDLVDWGALKEGADSLTVDLNECFPASVLSCSVASGGASETRLLLELGIACALSVQAVDFDHQAIPHAKLELWGARQSMGPALDCGADGLWEGTVFQADRLSLTVSALGYVPIGMRLPRPAASHFSETVALPRILAAGLLVDRRKNTRHHPFGYSGGSYDLAPWSAHLLREAEQSMPYDAENERVVWLTEPERADREAPVVHMAQFRVGVQADPIAMELPLKPLVHGKVRPVRAKNEWPRELVPMDLIVGPSEAWLATALPDRLVVGVEREGQAVVAQTAYRVPGDEPRFRFFVRPGWVRFVQLGNTPSFQAADYPPILASEWFQVKMDDASVAQLDVQLEAGVFYSEYRFLDSVGREHPGAGRIFGIAPKPKRPGWSEILVRSPRPQTSYFREGGTAQLWLAGRSGVGYLVTEAQAVRRPQAGQPWEVVVSHEMLARIGE